MFFWIFANQERWECIAFPGEVSSSWWQPPTTLLRLWNGVALPLLVLTCPLSPLHISLSAISRRVAQRITSGTSASSRKNIRKIGRLSYPSCGDSFKMYRREGWGARSNGVIGLYYIKDWKAAINWRFIGNRGSMRFPVHFWLPPVLTAASPVDSELLFVRLLHLNNMIESSSLLTQKCFTYRNQFLPWKIPSLPPQWKIHQTPSQRVVDNSAPSYCCHILIVPLASTLLCGERNVSFHLPWKSNHCVTTNTLRYINHRENHRNEWQQGGTETDFRHNLKTINHFQAEVITV